MSNSFNISVEPEIAALELKVDAIKDDTGPIRNDVTSIHDVNLPSVKADTGPIRNDVTAIHDTMLPSVKIDTGAIRNDVTDIHDTNLPAVKTDTGAIRNDVTDIKAVTDILPHTFRGTLKNAGLATASATYVEVLNITGAGKLYNLRVACLNALDQINIQFTIDGTSRITTHTGDTDTQWVIITSHFTTDNLSVYLIPQDVTDNFCYLNIEFSTSLLIEIKRETATNDNVTCGVLYSLD